MLRFFLCLWCVIGLGSAAFAGNAPVAVWVSNPVGPGETALIFGDGFAGCRAVRLARLPDDGGPLSWRTVTPLQVRPRSVKVALPDKSAPGLWRAQIQTPGGVLTTTINAPQMLWAQGDSGLAATPGGWLRVVGQSLHFAAGQPRIELKPPSGAPIELAPRRVERWALGAVLPSSVSPGKYLLRVHCGRGGAAGWSAPIPFDIRARTQLKATRVDVTTLGARGDDLEDDTAPLLQALRKVAAAGGGTVFLPRGRYLVSGEIVVPPGVVLRGAGMALTTLNWGDETDPPDALLRGEGHFGIEDLTVYATNHRHGIVAAQSGPGAGFVKIRRVRLRLNPYRGHLTLEETNRRFDAALKLSSGGGDSLRLGGPNLEVAGCDVQGGGRSIYLSGASGAWIHDNQFSNGRWGWYSLSGSDGLIFENNLISGGDLMSTGGGLNCLDGSMVSQNVLFSHNNLRTMYGWDREAMTSDAGGGAYFGSVQSAAGARLTLANDPQWNKRDWKGAGVFILDGRGQGQYRQVAGFSGREVTLDKPWAIAPDGTSVVTITMLQRNYIFVGNSFEDASVAIQIYGSSVGHIASDNVSARTAGFHNFGMNYDGIQPSWFVQWLDNRISEGNVYGGGHDQTMAIGEAHLGVFAMPPGGDRNVPMTLGCIVRGNHLDNNAHLAVGGTDPPNPALTYPFVQEVIVEKNRVENASVGLHLARAAAGVLARNNVFVNCDLGQVNDDDLENRDAKVRAKLYAKPGPLLHLDFEERDTSLFHDATGHGFDARCHGTCDTAPDGAFGRCLSLKGDSYLTVGRPNLLKMDSFTLSVWVRTDHLKGRWGILSDRIGSSPSPFVLKIEDGTVGFEATDASGAWSFNFGSAPVLKAGMWQHIAAVMQKGKGVTLWVDGREVAHRDNPSALSYNDEPLCIGRESWGGDPPTGSAPALFSGSLDEVQIWPRALSATDIARLANRANVKP